MKAGVGSTWLVNLVIHAAAACCGSCTSPPPAPHPLLLPHPSCTSPPPAPHPLLHLTPSCTSPPPAASPLSILPHLPLLPQIAVAVASGIGNARHLLQRMQAGEVHYDFVEVGAAP